MPAQQLPASFKPIPPELDVHKLVENTPSFRYATRISCTEIDEQGLHHFRNKVQDHVVNKGEPLVIYGYNKRLDPWIFTPQWLNANHGKKSKAKYTSHYCEVAS